MLIKLLGTLLLFVGGYAAAYVYQEEGRRTLGEIRSFLAVCEQLGREMAGNRRPIPAVLAALPPDVLSGCLGDGKVRPYTSMADFLSACPQRAAALADCLADLRGIGRGALSDDLRAVGAVRDRLAALLADREKKLAEQTRTLRVCLLGGAGLLAILLW